MAKQQTLASFFSVTEPRKIKKKVSNSNDDSALSGMSSVNTSEILSCKALDLERVPKRKRKISENDASFMSTSSGVSSMVVSTLQSPDVSSKNCTKLRKIATLDNDLSQQILDAGQKHFGPEQCCTCKMFYTPNHKEDAQLHEKFHENFLDQSGISELSDVSSKSGENRAASRVPSCFKLTGNVLKSWRKNLKPIQEHLDGSIYRISTESPVSVRKKTEQLFEYVNCQLGCAPCDVLFSDRRHVYVFVTSGASQAVVAACAVFEPAHAARRVLPAHSSPLNETDNDCLSDVRYSVLVGVNRIWSHPEYRGKKYAKRLIDCARSNVYIGRIVPVSKLAFTAPTPAGKLFAAKYCGSLDKVLVYSAQP